MGYRVWIETNDTRKWPTEGFARPWPDEITMTREVKERVDRMWRELGIE
jgi:4-hydroxy-3-polyprenylbenzoate decarboxylase